MRLLFDFFPIFFFFIGYKLFDIYVATIIAMVSSLIQIGMFWFWNRRIEFLHLVTLFIVLFLGGATLLLHNEIFIKWKPTVVYWVFAAVFFGSNLIGKKNFTQHLLSNKISLKPLMWKKLNSSWVVFFAIMGAVNLYIAYFFDTNVWVNFKLFGAFGCMLIFGIFQSLYISKHLKCNQSQQEK